VQRGMLHMISTVLEMQFTKKIKGNVMIKNVICLQATLSPGPGTMYHCTPLLSEVLGPPGLVNL